MRKSAIVPVFLWLLVALISAPLVAQPKSPRGKAETQVGSGFSKWVTIDYSRPILRGRQGIFGEGEAYGQKVNAGAPVWRAGADMSTRLKTEVPLVFGGTTVPAGEYSLFIDLESPTAWTLILSSHAAQKSYDPNNKDAIWGAYGYDSSKDVARAPMTVQPGQNSIDQLTFVFTGVTESGGNLSVAWDRTIASVPFTVGQ